MLQDPKPPMNPKETSLTTHPDASIFYLFISYIFVDASGWVISDVSFEFTGDFGSCNIRPPRPNDSVGIDLTPTPIPAAKLRIHTKIDF